MKKISASLTVQFIVYILLSLHSCKSDKPENIINPIVNIGGNGGVYIVNEGGFQFGNASISYYNETDKTITNDIFKNANNVGLGDVCQSMYLQNNVAYVVVNNSSKVEVISTHDFKVIKTIQGFVSPRYFLPVSNSKAYVSDLNSNKITIVNLSSNTITGSIPCHGWSEEMKMIYGNVFVTNLKSNQLRIVDAATDHVKDSIVVGYAPSSLVEDKEGKLWVLCVGDSLTNKAGSLYKINPINFGVEQSFNFSLADAPRSLKMNATLDTLYFLNRGIFQMPINQITLPALPFIPRDGRNIYGFDINPNNGNIYVADAIDYIQKGKIYCYTAKGNLLNSFNAGIIPNGFYFK
jgi:YVTN family beta-propeller protein